MVTLQPPQQAASAGQVRLRGVCGGLPCSCTVEMVCDLVVTSGAGLAAG